jgi:hypothetical protein
MTDEKEEKIERRKSKNTDFAALGIPAGSTLTFKKDPAITCKTVDDKNKVEYQGKQYTVSGLAKELMTTPISGYHAFAYNGVLLAKLSKTQTESASTPPPAAAPAEPAPVEPQASVSQTLPLPPNA